MFYTFFAKLIVNILINFVTTQESEVRSQERMRKPSETFADECRYYLIIAKDLGYGDIYEQNLSCINRSVNYCMHILEKF